MKPGFGKLVRMPGWELRFLLEASLALPVVWVGLKLYGLAALRTKLKARPSASRAEVDVQQLRRLGHRVNRIGGFELGAESCLPTSIVFDWLCRRRGIESDLCIGVRFAERRLQAHAWVEWGGIPLNDREDIALNFAPFPNLPPL